MWNARRQGELLTPSLVSTALLFWTVGEIPVEYFSLRRLDDMEVGMAVGVRKCCAKLGPGSSYQRWSCNPYAEKEHDRCAFVPGSIMSKTARAGGRKKGQQFEFASGFA